MRPLVLTILATATVMAIAIGKATIKYPNEGGALPNSSFFGGMGMGAMLGTTSLGHVIGIASIQGLAATGVL